MPLTHDEKREVMAALALSSDNPMQGLPILFAYLNKARSLGEWNEIHSLLDLIVPLLIHHRIQLDDAETFARELVQVQRDSAHLRVLARLCDTVGKTTEAQDLLDEAALVPSEHVDPETQAIIDEVFKKP